MCACAHTFPHTAMVAGTLGEINNALKGPLGG